MFHMLFLFDFIASHHYCYANEPILFMKVEDIKTINLNHWLWVIIHFFILIICPWQFGAQLPTETFVSFTIR